jgi:hypothetical protein
MEKLDLGKNSLRKFGVTMGVAFLAIALILFARGKHSFILISCLSAAFFAVAFTIPVSLKPVYIAWMRLAHILGWINTRLILLVMFYLIFTPIGIMIRLLGKDLLDKKIEKGKDSYWNKKEKADFLNSPYERQF